MNDLPSTALQNCYYPKRAHKCNYRLFTEKYIATELSFNSSIITFASFDNRHDHFQEFGSETTAASDCCSITNRGWMQEKVLRPIPLFSQINEEFID